jgi:ankyrin repeat protein
MRQLLEHEPKADPNGRDANDHTALHHIAMNSAASDPILLLLDNGANLESKGSDGRTAVDILKSKRINFNHKMLEDSKGSQRMDDNTYNRRRRDFIGFVESLNGPVGTATADRALIRLLKSKNLGKEATSQDRESMPRYIETCIKRGADRVRLVKRANASGSTKGTGNSFTTLHHAASHDWYDLAEFLLDTKDEKAKKSFVNQRSKKDETPLHRFLEKTEEANPKFLELLIASGADCNEISDRHWMDPAGLFAKTRSALGILDARGNLAPHKKDELVDILTRHLQKLPAEDDPESNEGPALSRTTLESPTHSRLTTPAPQEEQKVAETKTPEPVVQPLTSQHLAVFARLDALTGQLNVVAVELNAVKNNQNEQKVAQERMEDKHDELLDLTHGMNDRATATARARRKQSAATLH